MSSTSFTLMALDVREQCRVSPKMAVCFHVSFIRGSSKVAEIGSRFTVICRKLAPAEKLDRVTSCFEIFYEK